MYVLCAFSYTYFLVYGFLNILFVDAARRDYKACRQGVVPLHHVFRMDWSDKTTAQICKTQTKHMSLYRIPSKRKEPEFIQVVLTKPWDVSKVMVTFSGTVHDVSSHDSSFSFLSCAENHDTVLLQQTGNKTYCVHFLVNLHTKSSNIGRLWVTEKNGKVKGMSIKMNHEGVRPNASRFRRSYPEMPSLQYGNSSEKMSDISECGNTRSCYRYDKTNSQCGHMECSYFLSYTYKKTPEKTEYEFDMELSGRSSGWIAVGFSSDQQMMGDALICKTNAATREISVRAYQITMRHSLPTPKDGFVSNLTSSVQRNGYLYCRFQFRSGQDQIMEMTNDWFQLYAKGPITHNSNDGGISKHQETPLMSDYKISLIKSVDKMNVYTSAGSYVTSGPILWFLTWTFFTIILFFS
ncbi:uncharacterized protein LOC128162947 [Crassostrea angulata]|uniref:uncharacterized protein LOC128162947 n=1 Tax=Magallana angulata TaxID=2784310 RepID=UPI0022B1D548|nr:uncharacterized protein LOC128162947 [Crassostrea angulata]